MSFDLKNEINKLEITFDCSGCNDYTEDCTDNEKPCVKKLKIKQLCKLYADYQCRGLIEQVIELQKICAERDKIIGNLKDDFDKLQDVLPTDIDDILNCM